MKIQFLGTAAAEGWPAIFCNCDACKRAQIAGGRNIRTRSQAVIDDKLLIDFPADTYMHVLQHGLDLNLIKSCIVTHSHGDHLYPAEFEMRRVSFAYFDTETALTVYGMESVGNALDTILYKHGLAAQNRVLFQQIEAFVPFEVEGYQITPYKANHDPASTPVFYSISDGTHSILYSNDTGYYPDETWEYLTQNPIVFDVISLDCTTGVKPCRNGHMGIDTALEVLGRLSSIGCTHENTAVYLHHFSHNGGAIYDEILPIAESQHVSVTYDGLVVECVGVNR